MVTFGFLANTYVRRPSATRYADYRYIVHLDSPGSRAIEPCWRLAPGAIVALAGNTGAIYDDEFLARPNYRDLVVHGVYGTPYHLLRGIPEFNTSRTILYSKYLAEHC